MIINVAYASDIGHLPRKQQDALLVGDRVIQAPTVQPTIEDVQAEDCLIAVADGVTRGPAGEIPGRTSLEILAELWRGSRAKGELRPLSTRDIRTAQFRLCERLATMPVPARPRPWSWRTCWMMALTFSMSMIRGRTDHRRWRSLLFDERSHGGPAAHRGTGDPRLMIADYAADDFTVDVSTVRLAVGKGLLACTDGVIDALPRNVSDGCGEGKVTDRALRLVEQIMAGVSGEDNATLVVLRPSG